MSFQLNKAYDRDSFVEFLSDKFLPEDFRPKRNVEEIELTGSQNFAKHAYRLGECRSLGLEVFETRMHFDYCFTIVSVTVL